MHEVTCMHAGHMHACRSHARLHMSASVHHMCTHDHDIYPCKILNCKLNFKNAPLTHLRGSVMVQCLNFFLEIPEAGPTGVKQHRPHQDMCWLLQGTGVTTQLPRHGRWPCNDAPQRVWDEAEGVSSEIIVLPRLFFICTLIPLWCSHTKLFSQSDCYSKCCGRLTMKLSLLM